MTRSEVIQGAMELDPIEQELLLAELNQRIYGDEGPPISEEWLVELRRRVASVESGETTPIPAEEVHRRAREVIERMRSCK